MKKHLMSKNETAVFDFLHPEGWHAFVTKFRGEIRLTVYDADANGYDYPDAEEYDPSYVQYRASILKLVLPAQTDRSVGNLLIKMWTDVIRQSEIDMMEDDMLREELVRTNR